MKHSKKIAGLLVGCQLLLALTACENNSTDAENTNTSGNTTQNEANKDVTPGTGTELISSFDFEKGVTMDDIAGLNPYEVVATAGDIEITVMDLLYLATNELDSMYAMSMYGMAMPWGEEYEGVIYEDSVLQNAVELAVMYKIVDIKAAEQGFTVDEATQQLENDYLTDVMQAEVDGREDLFNLILLQSAVTWEQYLAGTTTGNLYGQIFNDQFSEGSANYPDDAEIVAFMEENDFYRVKHILLKTVDTNQYTEDFTGYMPLEDDVIQAQEVLVGELLAELNQLEGEALAERFNELMYEYSEDAMVPGQPNCGGEGYTTYPGQMVPEFEEMSMTLADGEMGATAAESMFGYHIILRLPLEASPEYAEEVVYGKAIAMQDSWLEEYEISTTEVFDKLDLQLYYENMTFFRQESTDYITDQLLGDMIDDAEEDSGEETEEDETP